MILLGNDDDDPDVALPFVIVIIPTGGYCSDPFGSRTNPWGDTGAALSIYRVAEDFDACLLGGCSVDVAVDDDGGSLRFPEVMCE